MNNIEDICTSIIESAKNQKEQIILSAKNRTENKIEQVKIELEAKEKASNEVVMNTYNMQLERAESMANLEINKLSLAAKQSVLDKIFGGVVNKLCNLDTERYQKLIESLLIKYAQQNDAISLSMDTKVDEDFITSLNVYKQKNLSFLDYKSNIKGGFVLVNPNCDTTVSFESLVEEYKEKYSNKIISELFN